jgi:hypothetical protein
VRVSVTPERTVEYATPAGAAEGRPAPGTGATVPAVPPRHPLNRAFDRVLVVAFLLAIALPLVGTWRHWDIAPVHENRVLADRPRIPHSVRETFRWPTAMLNYFSDRFGFRNLLIKTANTAVYRALGPTHGNDVIVGLDGWLFIHPNGGDHSFNTENGFNPFTEAQLDAWQELLEKRHAAAAARGLPMVVMIPPDKESIYPEYFPVPTRGRQRTRLDQLIERLRDTHSPVQIVDVRPALLREKAGRQLYRRTDTHWNEEGAYIGYRELMKAVARALPGFTFDPAPPVPVTKRDFGNKSGDLVGLMALDGEITEPWLDWQAALAYKDERREDNVHWLTVESPGGPSAARRPGLLMWRDSFATSMFYLVAPHFGRAVWVWDDAMDDAIMDAEKPDVVVVEFVERKLYQRIPRDSDTLRAITFPAKSAK